MEEILKMKDDKLSSQRIIIMLSGFLSEVMLPSCRLKTVAWMALEKAVVNNVKFVKKLL